jgi:apolipoprotein N-acyltransferase
VSGKPPKPQTSLLPFFLSLVAGGVLGLSAPGFGLWFLAWVGLIPLLILVRRSANWMHAVAKGFLFGFAYNCVYQNWYLQLAPLDWLGFNNWQGGLMALSALLFVASHQGLIVGIFALIYYLLPLETSFFFIRPGWKLSWPTLWTVPLLWVLVLNNLGNAHNLLGVPWSMIEYSQYLQRPIMQIASIIGGIGIGYLIVLVNVSLAMILASWLKKLATPGLSAQQLKPAIEQAAIVTIILLAVLVYGYARLASESLDQTTTASIIQPNINIELQKNIHKYTLSELYTKLVAMVNACPPGLIIASESAMPTLLSHDPILEAKLGSLAKQRNFSMVLGSIDQDRYGHLFNSAFGVSSDGHFDHKPYHKRYLVPFGEYTPQLVTYLPEWIKRLTNTPAGEGYTAGTEPVRLDLANKLISPLICFEVISPELVAQSVRAGGQLLVNLSDLAWFHRSMIGEQMLACAVTRAIENQRYLVFSANTGPSAIITPSGTITRRTGQGTEQVLIGKVGFENHLSWFTRWFLF